MKSKTLVISIIIVAALLLTGCAIGISTKVNADGSGELGVVYKLNSSDIQTLSSMGGSTDTANICSSLESSSGSSGLPAGTTLKQEKHGDETWCVATQSFSTIDALKTQLGGEGFTINTLEIQGGKLTFDADVDMGAGQDTSSMPFTINMSYDFTAPGKISNNDADKVNGNTATWNLEMGKTRHMHLESALSGGSSNKSGGSNSGSGSSSDSSSNKSFFQKYGLYIGIGLVCCCLIVVIVIVVVIFYMNRNKKKASTGFPA